MSDTTWIILDQPAGRGNGPVKLAWFDAVLTPGEPALWNNALLTQVRAHHPEIRDAVPEDFSACGLEVPDGVGRATQVEAAAETVTDVVADEPQEPAVEDAPAEETNEPTPSRRRR